MACGALTVSGTAQIYCVGGSAAGATTSTARVFSYNPVTDAITPLAAGDNWPGAGGTTNLPGGFTVFQNKLYILGGFTIGPAGALNTIYQFDPTSGGRLEVDAQERGSARGVAYVADDHHRHSHLHRWRLDRRGRRPDR